MDSRKAYLSQGDPAQALLPCEGAQRSLRRLSHPGGRGCDRCCGPADRGPYRHPGPRSAKSSGSGSGVSGKADGRVSPGGEMGLTGQNAFYTACAYLHGPVFVFGGAISVSLRWTAVSGTNPLSLAALDSSFPFLSPDRRHLPPAGGSLSKGEPLAEPASFVHTGQRQEEACC